MSSHTSLIQPLAPLRSSSSASKSLICLALLDNNLTPQDVATCLVKKPGHKSLKVFRRFLHFEKRDYFYNLVRSILLFARLPCSEHTLLLKMMMMMEILSNSENFYWLREKNKTQTPLKPLYPCRLLFVPASLRCFISKLWWR